MHQNRVWTWRNLDGSPDRGRAAGAGGRGSSRDQSVATASFRPPHCNHHHHGPRKAIQVRPSFSFFYLLSLLALHVCRERLGTVTFVVPSPQTFNPSSTTWHAWKGRGQRARLFQLSLPACLPAIGLTGPWTVTGCTGIEVLKRGRTADLFNVPGSDVLEPGELPSAEEDWADESRHGRGGLSSPRAHGGVW